jgi:uncharacterized membrane protein
VLTAVFDASKLVLTAAIVCGVAGIAWRQGLIAVAGVVLLIIGLLLRLLAPRTPAPGYARARFGPTSVATTIPSDADKPMIDIKPHD